MGNSQKPGSIIFSAALLIVSALWLRESLKINTLGIEWGGPRLFPLLISSALLVTSIFTFVSELLKTDVRYIVDLLLKSKKVPVREIFTTSLLLALTLAYAIIVKKLGFIIATFIVVLYSSLTFKAKVIDALLVSLVLSIGLLFLFKIILGVSLPEGILGW